MPRPRVGQDVGCDVVADDEHQFPAVAGNLADVSQVLEQAGRALQLGCSVQPRPLWWVQGVALTGPVCPQWPWRSAPRRRSQPGPTTGTPHGQSARRGGSRCPARRCDTGELRGCRRPTGRPRAYRAVPPSAAGRGRRRVGRDRRLRAASGLRRPAPASPHPRSPRARSARPPPPPLCCISHP
jgi:hypothetical protein